MKTTLTRSLLAPLTVAALLAGIGSAVALASTDASTHAAVTIRHQMRGCHSWSLDGGAYKPALTVTIRRGGSITIANHDVMPHRLIEQRGPAVTITRLSAGMGMGLKGTFPPAMLARMGASAKITFTHAGVYSFTTKAGEDYMSGIKTIGEDNVLRLKVTVA